MFLDLLDVMREPGKSVRRDFTMEEKTLDDIELAAPVSGWVRATNARQHIVIDGEAHAEVVLECARCLRDYAQPLELELLASVPLRLLRAELEGGSSEEGEEDEIDADEVAALYSEHRLDVSELVRQAIVLQTPPKPLCREDCPGLPEAAQYIGSEADPRFAALANWNAKNAGDTADALDADGKSQDETQREYSQNGFIPEGEAPRDAI
jgi:uncharacterized metal-binding protein YceD (DUF177 family)